MGFSQADQTNIENVGQHVGDYRRAWAALRQRIFEASNLSDDCGYFLGECKIVIFDEETAHASKVYAGKEVFYVQVEDKPAISM